MYLLLFACLTSFCCYIKRTQIYTFITNAYGVYQLINGIESKDDLGKYKTLTNNLAYIKYDYLGETRYVLYKLDEDPMAGIGCTLLAEYEDKTFNITPPSGKSIKCTPNLLGVKSLIVTNGDKKTVYIGDDEVVFPESNELDI